MKRFERKTVEVSQDVLVAATCDRCGISQEVAEYGLLIPVAIEVNYGEEFGRRDEYDYCNPCLVTIADRFVAAGSRSALVTGEDPPAVADWLAS